MTAVEYVLVLAGVAVLVAAVFVASPDAFGHVWDRVICQLGGSCSGQAGGGGPAVDPWDSANPITRATWGKMVVLGDSYSSGEGGNDYGVTGSTPNCHASANAYGPAVAKKLDMGDRLKVTACTGAVLKNLTEPYGEYDQPPQIGTVNDKTSLITMSLGGNDMDWSGILTDCVELTAGRAAASAVSKGAVVVSPIAGAAGPAVDVLGASADAAEASLPKQCGPSHDAEVEKRIKNLEPQLEKAYEKLHEQAPHARIVVLGYPRFFPTNPTTTLSTGPLPLINTQDEAWMNAKTEEFDVAIAKAAAAQGVEYVDTTNALDGHELTTADPWIFGLDRQNWHSIGPAQHDMHPKPEGQAAMAKLAERQIEHP